MVLHIFFGKCAYSDKVSVKTLRMQEHKSMYVDRIQSTQYIRDGVSKLIILFEVRDLEDTLAKTTLFQLFSKCSFISLLKSQTVDAVVEAWVWTQSRVFIKTINYYKTSRQLICNSYSLYRLASVTGFFYQIISEFCALLLLIYAHLK